MPNGKSNGSHLETFAKEIGSTKGLDPIPPDQYLTYQDKRYRPDQRLWSWLLSHTIRLGKRKAWAVNDVGKELTLQHAAADLGMDDANVRQAWRDLEADNRVRKDGRKLILAGDFKLPAKIKRSEVCTNLFPPYILKQLNAMPLAKRRAIETSYRSECDAELKYLKEATAAVRGIFTPRKDTILQTAGVKLIREDAAKRQTRKNLKSQAAPANPLRQIFASAIKPTLQESVQTSADRSVQTQTGGLYTAEKQAVQTNSASASLYSENPEIVPSISSSSAFPLKGTPAECKSEEEDSNRLYQIVKAAYPSDHFDEPHFKPSFERKSRDQQLHVIERLKLYRDCERWKNEDGRWIPLASTWLKTYEADPPPAIRKKQANKSNAAQIFEQAFAVGED